MLACSWWSCSIFSSTSASWESARDNAVLSSELPSMARLFANWAVFSASSGKRKTAEASHLTRKRDKSAGIAWYVSAMHIQQLWALQPSHLHHSQLYSESEGSAAWSHEQGEVPAVLSFTRSGHLEETVPTLLESQGPVNKNKPKEWF